MHWSEADVPFDLSSRSNLGLEHQVELDGVSQLVAGLGIDDSVLFDNLSKLRSGVVVDLRR